MSVHFTMLLEITDYLRKDNAGDQSTVADGILYVCFFQKFKKKCIPSLVHDKDRTRHKEWPKGGAIFFIDAS